MAKDIHDEARTAASAGCDGVAIGNLTGIDAGVPRVVFPLSLSDRATDARTTVALTSDDVGSDVALLFEDGDPCRPLIIGRILEAKQPAAKVVADGEVVRVEAEHRLELVCGKSKIVMEKDGRITIRGGTLVSHASAANRIRGGSVSLN